MALIDDVIHLCGTKNNFGYQQFCLQFKNGEWAVAPQAPIKVASTSPKLAHVNLDMFCVQRYTGTSMVLANDSWLFVHGAAGRIRAGMSGRFNSGKTRTASIVRAKLVGILVLLVIKL